MVVDYKQMMGYLNDIDLPVYICGHINPDQDSICSSLALMEYLKSKGKDVNVLLLTEDYYEIDWLGDKSGITNTVAKKDYAFIMVDMNESKRLGSFKTYFNNAKLTFNIDHHEENKFEADYTLSIPEISSTCEMVYNIFVDDKDFVFSNKICDLLYAGILSDSHSFNGRLTGETMIIAGNLIKNGARHKYIADQTFKKRTWYQMRALAKIINEVKYDEFYYVSVDMSKQEYKDLTYNQLMKQIAEDIKAIDDISVFLLMIKYPEKIVAKITSKLPVTADKIAKIFGGGGHKKGAGFTVMDKKEDEIVSDIKAFLKLNGF